MTKTQFNVRLDAETIRAVDALCAELKISQADVIRLAIRQMAKKEIPKKLEKIQNDR